MTKQLVSKVSVSLDLTKPQSALQAEVQWTQSRTVNAASKDSFLINQISFLAENFPNDLYYFLGSLQDRSQSRSSTCFSDRPHSPNHRQSKSVTFLLQCPVVVAHVSVLPWGKYKVNGNLQNGSELFFKILLFVAQEILQTLFLSDKRAGNNTWFYTDVFLCIAPRSILQRKEAFNAPRNIKNKLHITNGVWLCTWHFPQSTWASLSVSNPFSKFQQDKFCIGPHGYQTPLLYLNPG